MNKIQHNQQSTTTLPDKRKAPDMMWKETDDVMWTLSGVKSYQIKSNQIILYHTISYYIISNKLKSYYIISYQIK